MTLSEKIKHHSGLGSKTKATPDHEKDLGIDEEVAKILIDISMEFGRDKIGSMFVITHSDIRKYYRLLYPDLFSDKKINIRDKSAQMVVRKLADLDGAFILDNDGNILAYGAQLSKTLPYRGHGTRHSAALGISSLPKTISIVSSEEDGCVRIFRKGITLVEINPFTKTPPTLSERIADLITSSNISLLGGGSLASIALGVNPFVAAIVFTGSYIATKSGVLSLGDFLRKSGKEKEKKKED